MESEIFLEKLTFWLFVIGLFLEVALCIVAVIAAHNEDLFEKNKNLFKKLIEWFALVGALMVFFAILTEHWLGKLEIADKRQLNDAFLVQSNRLVRAESEILVQSNALVGAKIKPLKGRLIDCLNSIDARVIPALKKYGKNVQLNAPVKQYQYVELQSISSEKGASEYIAFKDIPPEIYASGDQIQRVEIDISPSLVR